MNASSVGLSSSHPSADGLGLDAVERTPLPSLRMTTLPISSTLKCGFDEAETHDRETLRTQPKRSAGSLDP